MAKVLIADKLSQRAIDSFATGGVEADVMTGLDPDALKAVIGDYDGLVIRSATKVTADVLEAGRNLKVVGRAGIGVDNVDLAAATERGIVVMNTPFGNTITTAEHAIALMLSLARSIPQANQSTHQGKWEKSRFVGVEVTGKTLGVIGCGNIGSIVADRARGLKMRVLAYDPFLSPARATDLGVQRVELDELYAKADFITLHAPETDQTRHMINAAAIAKMQRGVRLINCARGGLVVEADLKAALESGHVAGAALDVFEHEPATENGLFGMDNVVVTPHLGASTEEAQENVATQIAKQVTDFLLRGAVVNALNMPSVSTEEAPRMRPYVKLADQLGSFAGQITRHGVRGITIEYSGQVAALNTRPLTAVVLEGFLRPLLDSVNMVNAPILARQRNIEVVEKKRDRADDYLTLIRLTVDTEMRERTVAGTLIGGDKPRVVDVEGISVEANLGSNMLFVRNRDEPGFIGALGQTLGDANINIGTFHLGRSDKGGDAIAFVEVDQAIPQATLDAVNRIPHVIRAHVLSF
ncbi:MAG: phosphoglycerate dehydrogenase [Alphaproteobacteria bacterium]|nr:phosphoglycerate dehydrogenase [Alphaproteobacteria bacterium]